MAYRLSAELYKHLSVINSLVSREDNIDERELNFKRFLDDVGNNLTEFAIWGDFRGGTYHSTLHSLTRSHCVGDISPGSPPKM
jgi:hypothetical protein